MPTFNLVDRPWIPVLFLDGTTRECSLKEVVKEATTIAQIQGNPLESAVLHRLLLALAHLVNNPNTLDDWLAIWNSKESLLQQIDNYLSVNHAKLDLYDSKFPFAQNINVENIIKTPANMIYERSQGNNAVFIDGSLVSKPQPIPSSVAARSLLVFHACGGSGTGSQNPFDKSGTMYAGPLCARMIALIEGKNLAETLVLNMAIGRKIGTPTWDRPLCNPAKLTQSSGLSDLYTRATRNVLLIPNEDGAQCIGINSFMGEGINSEAEVTGDPHLPLYLSKDKTFKPLRIDPKKALWRNSSALLAHKASADTKPLASVALLAELKSYGLLEDLEKHRIRTLGASADAKGPVTELWRDESLPFSLSLFNSDTDYQHLATAVETAEQIAKTLSGRLYRFAASYLSNGGGAPDRKDVDKLIDEICPNLNDYWLAIGPEGEKLAIQRQPLEEWLATCNTASHSAFQKAIDRLTPDSRRLRAQFATSSEPSAKTKGSKTA